MLCTKARVAKRGGGGGRGGRTYMRDTMVTLCREDTVDREIFKLKIIWVKISC